MIGQYISINSNAQTHDISAVASSASNLPTGSNMHPVMAAFFELMNDAYLRYIIFGLSAILQTITTDCPTALVWHYFGENKSPSSLLGSPLDYLPRSVYSILVYLLYMKERYIISFNTTSVSNLIFSNI